ncbi:fimbrial protein [Arsenophonus apicola]|uniref:Fimbrial protein n=1 Tax=Arsenophonus apicola TaxID=2879119 RepID=A0ABY8NYY4_9GAMM|nr:fimbrial protein [Arsenophonus apicola]WGO82450.1 fimbrial protein [Arsenophonus apicola]
MRKLLMALSLSVTALSQFSAYGNSGSIIFNGQLVGSTCQVTVNTKNQTVTLDTLSINNFQKKNDTSIGKSFNIALAQCQPTDNISVVFHDARNGFTEDGLIANQAGDDYAKGIAIGIYDNDNNLIKMNEKIALDNNNDTRNLALIAKYVATENQVEAGQVASTVNFTITY